MNDPRTLLEYLLRLADCDLILAQRLGEWVGHGPVLEEDIATTNVGLDLLGQSRLWFAYAGEVEAGFNGGAGRSEDELAFLRDAAEFRNLMLVEQPNGDYAVTMARQFYFDAWHELLLRCLTASTDARIAEIAAKALKEVRYHGERSADWVIRLGDGTGESHRRMQAAVDDLWMYTGEMFDVDPIELALIDAGIACDARTLAEPWRQHVAAVFAEATLTLPAGVWMQGSGGRGGKQGVHTEHIGPMLAQMQWLQRAYPGGAMVSAIRSTAEARPTMDAIWAALAAIPDPEIPVISLVELGIVRDVCWRDGELVVTLTPTYSGCPATEVIAADVAAALAEAGIVGARIETRLSPPWTTDWIAPAAKTRLAEYGIAPPRARAAVQAIDIAGLTRRVPASPVPCPRCGSTRTRELSRFGSTPCKAQHRCEDCLEPFDYFKPH